MSIASLQRALGTAVGNPSDLYDGSLTIAATNVPQILVEALAGSKALIIQNLSANSIAVGFNSSITVGGLGTINIPAGALWEPPNRFTPTNPMYVVGTAGSNVTCWFR